MQVPSNFNRLKQPKRLWSAITGLVLSVLLLAPAPALALTDTSTLQSSVSILKSGLEHVLNDIKTLPTQPYEDSKNLLKSIDNQLDQVKTNAGNLVKEAEKLSNQAQTQYMSNLDLLSKDKTLLNAAEKVRNAFREERSRDWAKGSDFLEVDDITRLHEGIRQFCQNQGVNITKLGGLNFTVSFSPPPLSSIEKSSPPCVMSYLKSQFPHPVSQIDRVTYVVVPSGRGQGGVREFALYLFLQHYNDLAALHQEVKGFCTSQGVSIESNQFNSCADSYLRKTYPYNQSCTNCGSDAEAGIRLARENNCMIPWSRESSMPRAKAIDDIRAYGYLTTVQKLEQSVKESNDNLANIRLLSKKVSDTSDALGKKIDLALTKSSVVKQYAVELQSFQDSETLTEIKGLYDLVATTTRDL